MQPDGSASQLDRGMPERALHFCQAEDGIRDLIGTGVQTCALPISGEDVGRRADERGPGLGLLLLSGETRYQIGRASCRESVDLGGRRIIKKKKKMIADETISARDKAALHRGATHETTLV